MDVNMLKEIDLAAFGRRVHVYNGIKELRRQVEALSAPPTTAPALSPTFSGYEPDTPSSRAFSPRDSFSPSVSTSQGGFASAPNSARGLAATTVSDGSGTRRNSDQSALSIPKRTSSDVDRAVTPSNAGLGLEEQRPMTATSKQSGHARSMTTGTYDTAPSLRGVDEDDADTTANASVLGSDVRRDSIST